MTDRFIFKRERKEMTSVSDTTWWRMEQRGEAPKRRQISPGRVAWLQSEIVSWIGSRPVSDLKPPERGESA